MKNQKEQDFQINVDMKAVSSFPGVYANHSLINVNPFETNILFSTVDGFEAASKRNEDDDKILSATPVAKIILSHKAFLELAQCIQTIVEQMKRDGEMRKDGKQK